MLTFRAHRSSSRCVSTRIVRRAIFTIAIDYDSSFASCSDIGCMISREAIQMRPALANACSGRQLLCFAYEIVPWTTNCPRVPITTIHPCGTRSKCPPTPPSIDGVLIVALLTWCERMVLDRAAFSPNLGCLLPGPLAADEQQSKI
jgi:hypothetical protein